MWALKGGNDQDAGGRKDGNKKLLQIFFKKILESRDLSRSMKDVYGTSGDNYDGETVLERMLRKIAMYGTTKTLQWLLDCEILSDVNVTQWKKMQKKWKNV